MNKNKILLYVLYLLVIAGLAYALYTTQGFGLWKSKNDSFKTGNWQAVFLTNGQVYFGHMDSLNSQFINLTEIYYLQVQKPIQPKSTDDQGKLSLIKLGNEIHGPTDAMKINRDQVLFVEDLGEEGKVMQAIKRYKEQGPDQSSASPTATETPTATPTSTSTKTK